MKKIIKLLISSALLLSCFSLSISADENDVNSNIDASNLFQVKATLISQEDGKTSEDYVEI